MPTKAAILRTDHSARLGGLLRGRCQVDAAARCRSSVGPLAVSQRARQILFLPETPGQRYVPNTCTRLTASLGDTPEYNLVVKDTAGLFSLVQMGVLEIHAWGCLADKIEMPDRLVFDLDPDPAMPWPEVIAAAREIRELLEELGFKSFLKTTGGKGLHIVMPVRPRLAWEEAKAFCRAVVDLIVRVFPACYVGTMSKAARKGKIFITIFATDGGQRRSLPTRHGPDRGAGKCAHRLGGADAARSDALNVSNVPSRLERLKKDPWAAFCDEAIGHQVDYQVGG